jgi:hypothetical protein
MRRWARSKAPWLPPPRPFAQGLGPPRKNRGLTRPGPGGSPTEHDDDDDQMTAQRYWRIQLDEEPGPAGQG